MASKSVTVRILTPADIRLHEVLLIMYTLGTGNAHRISLKGLILTDVIWVSLRVY